MARTSGSNFAWSKIAASFVVAVGYLAATAGAKEPSPTDEHFFAARVQPILARHCVDCHGADEAKSGLRFDTIAGLRRGGESGEPLIIAGRSDESYLLRRITAENARQRMPPDADPLPADDVAALRTWIDAGAKLPDGANAATELKLTTDHWSFQPVVRPPTTTPGREIDGFITAKLAEKKLSPSPEADRRTLVRRLYLIAHGLPPTPAEVQAFVDDRRPGAYERMVDRVLASPRFGERWARHWMDVVRYGDTNGFETNRERKTAYHYRDYLIAAFNDDKPYDQFIREQLAGDALGAPAATGFLVAGPYDIVKSREVALQLMQRQDELADMVNTTATAFLGLTMGCARCHHHKFDPILQKDYYAMQAVFAGVRHGERPLGTKPSAAAERELTKLKSELAAKEATLAELQKPRPPRDVAATKKESDSKLRPPVTARLNEETFAPVEAIAVRFIILAANNGQPCLDELELYDAAGKNVALAVAGAKAVASGTLAGHAIHQLAHVHDGQTGNAHSWISNTVGRGWVQIDLPAPTRLERVVWSRDRTGRYADRIPTEYKIEVALAPGKWQTIAASDDREPFVSGAAKEPSAAQLSAKEARQVERLKKELAELRARITKLAEGETAWIGRFDAKPQPTHRLYRGEPMQPREVVAPDALTVFGTLGLGVDEPEQQRRLRLAEWIASPQNPLTARVMVNRLWHYTFGVGLVDTPSDFGANGSRPTHPELLDWLADEFVRSGWSMKHVLRLLFNSATFRQASTPRAEAAAIDADGRLLWRYTPRRLEGEAIRDGILAASGALDLKLGGPGFYLHNVQHENVVHYFPKEEFTPAEFRRMVYLYRVRAAPDGVFGAFDCPDGNSVTPRRSRSNTPLQALNLFNSRFVVQQAEIFAERLQTEAGDDVAKQIAIAFRLCFAREPDAFEIERSTAMIRENGLPSFCRALFNASELLFVF
jgi:mono/diheme cytochrome c family protein